MLFLAGPGTVTKISRSEEVSLRVSAYSGGYTFMFIIFDLARRRNEVGGRQRRRTWQGGGNERRGASNRPPHAQEASEAKQAQRGGGWLSGKACIEVICSGCNMGLLMTKGTT